MNIEERTMKPPALIDFRGPRELEAWRRITDEPDRRLPDDDFAEPPLPCFLVRQAG